MWDVKQLMLYGLGALEACFTLTMWDVKFASSFVVGSRPKGFYLNYVGCKGITRRFARASRFSFTLTMWDVKISMIGAKSVSSCVLP